MIESAAASILLSETISFAKNKAKESYDRQFGMKVKVDKAAKRTADVHTDLTQEMVITLFDNRELAKVVEDFKEYGGEITEEKVAEHIEVEWLEIDQKEKIVKRFVEELYQEFSSNESFWRHMQIQYHKDIQSNLTGMEENQEEILDRVKSIEEKLPTDEISQTDIPLTEIDYRFGECGYIGTDLQHQTSLYGREENLDHIADFIESGQSVLLIEGADGLGKTRFVVEAALKIQLENPQRPILAVDPVGDLQEALVRIDDDILSSAVFIVDDLQEYEEIDSLYRHVSANENCKAILTGDPKSVTDQKINIQSYGLIADSITINTLDADTIDSLLRSEYNINHQAYINQITTISEGIPQLIHLFAEFTLKESSDEIDSVEAIFRASFDETLNSLRSRLVENSGLREVELEKYIRYLAGIGTLNTNNQELLEQFRERQGISEEDEKTLRDIVSRNSNIVKNNSGLLQIEPDGLRLHIIYRHFFDDRPYDYRSDIYEPFKNFTEKEMLNSLLAIEGRYENKNARRIITDILGKHIERVPAQSAIERAETLRICEDIGVLHPLLAIELVEECVMVETPQKENQGRIYTPRLMADASDLGNLYLRAAKILWSTILSEPVNSIRILLSIADAYDGARVTKKIFQYIRQTIEPQVDKSSTDQKEVVVELFKYIHEGNSPQITSEIIDVVEHVSNYEVRGQVQDPASKNVIQFQRSIIPQTEAHQNLRITTIRSLFEVVTENPTTELSKKAASALVSFCHSQLSYKDHTDEVYNKQEIEEIYDFSIAYSLNNSDIDCLRELYRLAYSPSLVELEVEEKMYLLESRLNRNSLFKYSIKMDPTIRGRPTTYQTREDAIRSHIRDISDPIEDHYDIFEAVVSNSSRDYSPFFQLLAEEYPEQAIQYLEASPEQIEIYRGSMFRGICKNRPETGMDLAARLISNEQVSVVSRGLVLLLEYDFQRASELFERSIKETDEFSPVTSQYLIRSLSKIWKSNQAWAERQIQKILESSERNNTQLIEEISVVIPCHSEEIECVSKKLLIEILDYVSDFSILSNIPCVSEIIEEIAERDPEEYLSFCEKRKENGHTGIDMLPYRMSINKERMKSSDNYSSVAEDLAQKILSNERIYEYSGMFSQFPVEGIVNRLTDKIDQLSDEECYRVLSYCNISPLNDQISYLMKQIMEKGIDDIRNDETAKSQIHSILVNSTSTVVGSATEETYARQFEIIREWKHDQSLDSSVRNFADELEQDFYGMVEE